MAARRLHPISGEGAPGAVCRASGPRATGPLAAREQASVRQSGGPWPELLRRSASHAATTARATACSMTTARNVGSPLLLELGPVLVGHRDRPQRSDPPLLDMQVIGVLLRRGP